MRERKKLKEPTRENKFRIKRQEQKINSKYYYNILCSLHIFDVYIAHIPTQRGQRAHERRIRRGAIPRVRQHVVQSGHRLPLQTCGLRDKGRLGGRVREVQVEASGGREGAVGG
jgi:hypothetical protein